MDKPLPGEDDSNPTNIKEGLAKGENYNNDEANKPNECNKESTHKIDHLAQICCDKEGLGFENLSFSRRITRSMHSIHSIPGYRFYQQTPKSTATKPIVVDIEDDIPSSIPNTMDVGNSAIAQGSDAQSGEVEGNQPEININTVDLEPLHN